MQIRLVRPDEHEDAGALVVAAYRALDGSSTSGGYEAELADVGRRSAETDVLVATDGAGPLLGCVTFVPDHTNPWAEHLLEGEASVRMLAVAPQLQGRGVGRALLEACIDRARDLGSTAVFLHSTPWMVAAHHIYTASGFVRVPDRDWLPVPEVPLLAFRLELYAAHGGVNPQ